MEHAQRGLDVVEDQRCVRYVLILILMEHAQRGAKHTSNALYSVMS